MPYNVLKENILNTASLGTTCLGITIYKLNEYISLVTPILVSISIVAAIGVSLTAIVYNIVRTKKIKGGK